MEKSTKSIILKVIEYNNGNGEVEEIMVENVVVSKYNLMRNFNPIKLIPEPQGQPIIIITSNLPDFLQERIDDMVKWYCNIK